MPAEDRLLILIPTYNEAQNVEPLLNEILAVNLEADILFVNDHSTDGTDEILVRLSSMHPRVHLLQRASKQGIGSAHQAGINWAYDHRYRRLLTMDADFTHSPACIPAFLEKAHVFDLVIASRFLDKDSLPDWTFFRRSLTYLGHFMTVLFLRMPLDATGAFRLYRLDKLPREIFRLVRSPSYSFFFESLFVIWFNRFSIAEIPIVLPARIQGHSKMVLSDAIESFRFLIGLFNRRLFERHSLRCPVSNALQTDGLFRVASVGGEKRHR